MCGPELRSATTKCKGSACLPQSQVLRLRGRLACHLWLCLAGFQEGYPYPYPHTLYLMETADLQPHRFHPEQLRAKMILFAFGSALAQARLLYGVCMWGDC